MSKTMKFNASVTLGKTAYAAGQPVPIGGKTGLSEDEAANLVRNFGHWEGAGVSPDGDDLVDIKLQLKAAQAGAEQALKLEADVLRLNGELAARPTLEALEAEKFKVTELEGDVEALAAEIENLKADAVVKNDRIKVLEGENADLKKNGAK